MCSEKLEAEHSPIPTNATVANHNKSASLIVVLLTCCRLWMTVPIELPCIETLTAPAKPTIDYCATNNKERRIPV